MTPFQVAFWLADAKYIEQLSRWRLMTPKVRTLMRNLEGFQLV